MTAKHDLIHLCQRQWGLIVDCLTECPAITLPQKVMVPDGYVKRCHIHNPNDAICMLGAFLDFISYGPFVSS